MLFLVQCTGAGKSRLFVFWAAVAAALAMTTKPTVDPFAWASYVAYSLIVYAGSGRFRQWVMSRQEALEEERNLYSRKLDAERAWLRRTSEETEVIRRQADEVSYLCDKIKEMSQTLDKLEAFLVFGEALSKNFKFDCLKLVLFAENQPSERGAHVPEKVFQLLYSDFEGFFDRNRFLKEPALAKGKLFDFDRRVLESVFEGSTARQESMGFAEESAPFMAHPVYIQHEIVGVLLLIGVDAKDFQILSILTKSFIAEIQRIHLFRKVQTLAVTDGLTEIAVRRHFLSRLEGELERSLRLKLKISFLMIDIDDFKNFNDHYGHLVGDVVLRDVADAIKKNIREIDLVGRYGGEEFAVFLAETDESGAFFVAERIRRAIEERDFKAYDENLKVTVSIGCATLAPSGKDAQELLETADAALYEAKRLGKNRVHVSDVDNDLKNS